MKSTLRREFDVSLALDALEGARRHRRQVRLRELGTPGRRDPPDGGKRRTDGAAHPSPRGDKNGADINLALDALEMAFTHTHVNAFAIVSGDSDFIPLVNKLKEYGKTVFVVGGKAFTSTILQQNCHEFISFESLLSGRRRNVRPCSRDADLPSPRAATAGATDRARPSPTARPR